MTGCKLLLFDLDGTLLRSDKTISNRTIIVLQACRDAGIMIGVCTARSQENAWSFIRELDPDVLITSGGALVKFKGEYIYRSEFSEEETNRMIMTARAVCGPDCEITVDTVDHHYWNYRIDPKTIDSSWGNSIYTDFTGFQERSLKMCVEIFEDSKAKRLQELLNQCDCVRFSDGYWYKFTKRGTTKENAILEVCSKCRIKVQDIIAFGDDYSDIDMIKLCGRGIAMGNAIAAVKNMADQVIGDNDEDSIAKYLSAMLSQEEMIMENTRSSFEFSDTFDSIAGPNGLHLEIIEKNPGDDVILPFYWYDIYVGGNPVGKISIRIGDNYHSYYNGHVGYEVDPESRGHRYSLEALKLVLPVAKHHGMERIYLTCDQSNEASRRIIELSGAKLLEIAKIPRDYFAWREGIEDHCIYQLDIR